MEPDEVFWIAPNELEFGGRFYKWDGQMWTDKNGVARTSYLLSRGAINISKGSKGKNRSGSSYNNQGGKGKNRSGSNKEVDKGGKGGNNNQSGKGKDDSKGEDDSKATAALNSSSEQLQFVEPMQYDV